MSMERDCRSGPHRVDLTLPRRPTWRCCLAVAVISFITSTTLFAKPIEVVYPEGVSEGFVTLKTLDGKKLADGELSQVTTGADRLASRLTFRFSDGSLYDETVTYSQKKHLTMLSYQLTQRGPASPNRSSFRSMERRDTIRSASTKRRRMKSRLPDASTFQRMSTTA